MFLIAFASAGAFASDARVVFADGANYKTKVVFANRGIAPATFTISTDGFGTSSDTVTIAAGGAASATPRSAGFTLFESPAGIDATSVISFDDGKTPNSFSIGAIGYTDNTTQRFGPIVSNVDEGTWITTFPKVATPLTVDVFDGGRPFTNSTRELYEASPPVNQYRVKAKTDAGFIAVSVGWPGFTQFDRVYGFVNVGTEKNGNFRPFPFRGGL